MTFDSAVERLSGGNVETRELKAMEPVLRAGVRTGGRRAVVRLLSLLGTGDTALMAVIAGVLTEQPEESRDVLIGGLSGNAPPELRPYYAHLLGLQHETAALPALERATQDPDDMVAYWARWALDRIHEVD